MAFGDTVTITINAVAKVLNKINQDQYTTEYLLRETDREFGLRIRHTKDKTVMNGFPVERHYVVLTETKYPVTGVSLGYTRSIAATILADRTDDQAGHKLFDAGLVGFLTPTNVGKLLNWES